MEIIDTVEIVTLEYYKFFMAYSQIGLQRLAITITKSFELQDIALREVKPITDAIFGKGIDKMTICNLSRGTTFSPKPETLQRIAPLVFRVNHFRLINDDLIGIPIFEYDQGYFNKEDRLKTIFSNSVHKLPYAEYRYSSWQELEAILKEETPCKKLFLPLNSQKELQLK